MIVDEAHESLGHSSTARDMFTPSRRGHCLVTYHPSEICAEASDSIDVLIALPPTTLDPDDPIVAATASFTGVQIAAVIEAFRGLPNGAALLADRTRPGVLRPFRLGARLTDHVRHWHKYATRDLLSHRRFFFRRSTDDPTGRAAANLNDFHHELLRCEPEVITHHARGHDFSRWIRGVFRDDRLAAELERVESDLVVDPDGRVGTARRRILAAIEQRYPARWETGIVDRSSNMEGCCGNHRLPVGAGGRAGAAQRRVRRQ